MQCIVGLPCTGRVDSHNNECIAPIPVQTMALTGYQADTTQQDNFI